MEAKIAEAYIDWEKPFVATKRMISYEYKYPANIVALNIFDTKYYVDRIELPKGDSNVTRFYLINWQEWERENGYLTST